LKKTSEYLWAYPVAFLAIVLIMATAAHAQDSKSASKPASAGEQSASASQLKLGPVDPSVPPTDLPKNRPVIGVALGGGGALAMSDIGVLQWFE